MIAFLADLIKGHVSFFTIKVSPLCVTGLYKFVRVLMFNATFNHILVMSLRSVLLVEEIRVPGKNHRPVTSH